MLIASASPNPTVQGKVRSTFGAHFVEVEVDTELGRARVTRYLAVHDCGRIMNPLTARSQIKGGATMGIGMALHEDLIYDRRSGTAAVGGLLRRARRDASRRAGDRGHLHRERRRLGPFGAKSMGESSKVPSPAAVANAVFNAIGVRMKDLPITRDKIVAALARDGRCGHEGLHQRQPARRRARGDADRAGAAARTARSRSPAAAATCSA